MWDAYELKKLNQSMAINNYRVSDKISTDWWIEGFRSSSFSFTVLKSASWRRLSFSKITYSILTRRIFCEIKLFSLQYILRRNSQKSSGPKSHNNSLGHRKRLLPEWIQRKYYYLIVLKYYNYRIYSASKRLNFSSFHPAKKGYF